MDQEDALHCGNRTSIGPLMTTQPAERVTTHVYTCGKQRYFISSTPYACSSGALHPLHKFKFDGNQQQAARRSKLDGACAEHNESSPTEMKVFFLVPFKQFDRLANGSHLG